MSIHGTLDKVHLRPVKADRLKLVLRHLMAMEFRSFYLVNLSGNLCAINLIAPIFFYNNYSLIAGNKDVTVLNRITHV